MYRHVDRPTEPTVIAYRAKTLRLRSLALAIFVIVIGIGVFMAYHVTHITCDRASDDAAAMCRVRRYSGLRPLDETLALAEIGRFEVKLQRGSKGAPFAEVRLLTPTRQPPVLELGTGGWGHIAPETATAARDRFESFANDVRQRTFEQWFWLGKLNTGFMFLFGLLPLVYGVLVIREQLVQLRPIRLVVDHAREVVVVRDLEVRFAEVDSVTIERGAALKLSSKQNETIPGWRLVIVRREGEDVPVTTDFRAGSEGVHASARTRLLHALGREV